MNLATVYDLSILVNDSERMVLEELGYRLDSASVDGLCTCQDCVLDIAVLALNSLKPHYHASLLGTMYAQAESIRGYSDDVKHAVDDAIMKVRAQPRHP